MISSVDLSQRLHCGLGAQHSKFLVPPQTGFRNLLGRSTNVPSSGPTSIRGLVKVQELFQAISSFSLVSFMFSKYIAAWSQHLKCIIKLKKNKKTKHFQMFYFKTAPATLGES